MNRQQFEKLMVKYRSVKNGDIQKCGKRMNEVWNWINQNYISKQQILNLECLKEEEETCVKEDVLGNEYLVIDNIKVGRNNLRKEIKDEITKDLFKDFKQVSNPLDEDYE